MLLLKYKINGGAICLLKKNDIILMISIVFTAVLVMFLVFIVPSGSAKTVTVKQNNETVYTGALKENGEIKLSGNTVVIKDGQVYMLRADCKNQICVKHKKISKNGESIVCLPNKVTVEIGK